MPTRKIRISLDQFQSLANKFVWIVALLLTSTTVYSQWWPLDIDFRADVGPYYPYVLAVQEDARIVVGGGIRTINGFPRYGLGRLLPNGQIDVPFNADVVYTNPIAVYSLAFVDNRILVAGRFIKMGGYECDRIARLNSDGTVDNTFSANLTGSSVWCMVVQPDGRILIGGEFTHISGEPRDCIGRLNPDGSLDSSFNSSVGASGVYCMGMQPDGKVVIGGVFTNVPGGNLVRLNIDGSIDSSFSPELGAQARTFAVAIQPDGKILAGSRLKRLNPDGTQDTNFNAVARLDFVSCIQLQVDGKILVAGGFSDMNGLKRYGVGRLNSDGTADPALDTGIWLGASEARVCGAMLEADGKILVGGSFNAWSLPILSRFYGVARFHNTDPATQALTVNGSSITWERGGTSPEVWRTTFEASPDGTNWVLLGDGIRVPGGWQLNNASVPLNSMVRVCGFTFGGFDNACSSIIRAIWPKAQPYIVADNANSPPQTNRFGLNIIGTPGEIVVLESSSDFLDWTPEVTNTMYAAPSYFSDACVTNVQNKFYRCRLQ